MDKFLDTYDHPKLNQEDINDQNRSIIFNKIEAGIKNLPKKRGPGPDRFSTEFYQTSKEELRPTLLKVFHEIEREETLPNSFYEVSIHSFSNRTRTQQKKRITGKSLNEYRCKNPQ
jgi:hypothetical protein